MAERVADIDYFRTIAQSEAIAHRAINQPWPGENGPRALQVLVALLRRLDSTCATSLVIDADLDSLAIEAGLLRHQAAKGALEDLQADGWSSYTPGTPNARYVKGTPSRIQLTAPTVASGRFEVTLLPLVTLDIFSYGELGSAGFLLMARLATELHNVHDDPKPYALADLGQLTGMYYKRIQRLLPKMVSLGLATKSSDHHTFAPLYIVNNTRTFSDGIFRERREKLEESRKREPQQPTPIRGFTGRRAS